MAIRGSLTEASLPDVLQLLAMGKKTGCLGLTFANNFGYIYFDGGFITHASIVNRALSTEEAVYILFTWSQGAFNFEPGVSPDPGVATESLDPQALMLEGARRVDEWALIAKKIPTFDIVYASDRHRLMEEPRPLTADEERLLHLLDGQRDVSAIISESGLGEFATAKALYGLLTGGYVVRVGVSARRREVPPPNDKAAEHRNLGLAFYKTGMYEEAEREFRRVAALRHSDAEADFYMGLVALRQGRWRDAAEALERSAAHGPPRVSVFVDLAYAYERIGDLDRAQRAISEALARGGRGEPLVQTGAASLAIRMRDFESAEAALATARSLYGARRPPPAWYHYASLAAALTNDVERAIAILTEGVQAYPSVAALWNNLALAQEVAGDLDGAVRTLERGLVEDPTLSQLHRNFADVLQRLSRRAPGGTPTGAAPESGP